MGGALSGFDRYDEAVEGESTADLEDPTLGNTMLYTSGTTGRPKGVRRPPFSRRPGLALVAKYLDYRSGEDVNLCTGPLYHAAPLAFSLAGPLAAGVGIVLMDGWDSEQALDLIERHRITHTHMVPTMFHRVLALPERARSQHDLSSLRLILHGAAPCPVTVKRALIDWLGPIVYEYYRDEDKTRGVYDAAREYFTLGDMGYMDGEGYLYLTDRSADVIISGGATPTPPRSTPCSSLIPPSPTAPRSESRRRTGVRRCARW